MRVAMIAGLFLGLALPPVVRADEADVAAEAQPWVAVYGLPAACPVEVARRESTFDPTVWNGQYYGLYQFGPGETTIWNLSSDWQEERLEPWQVPPAETTRVFMELVRNYPALANSSAGWGLLPSVCR